MLGKGFLGTRADWLMDLVIVSLVVIVPVILYSWGIARKRNYLGHKRIQVWLTAILTVVVLLFEVDIRLAGGMAALFKGSRFANTALLDGTTYVHLFFSVTTSIIWIALIILSLRRFDHPPRPNKAFSATHKFWGKIGMVWMIMTGVTGLGLYILGFAF